VKPGAFRGSPRWASSERRTSSARSDSVARRARAGDAKPEGARDIVETMTAAGEDLLEVNVDGKVVRVVSRPAHDDR